MILQKYQLYVMLQDLVIYCVWAIFTNDKMLLFTVKKGRISFENISCIATGHSLNGIKYLSIHNKLK